MPTWSRSPHSPASSARTLMIGVRVTTGTPAACGRLSGRFAANWIVSGVSAVGTALTAWYEATAPGGVTRMTLLIAIGPCADTIMLFAFVAALIASDVEYVTGSGIVILATMKAGNATPPPG